VHAISDSGAESGLILSAITLTRSLDEIGKKWNRAFHLPKNARQLFRENGDHVTI
jgi:hypothetical protein